MITAYVMEELTEVIKFLKTSIELIQIKQQRYLNHADIFFIFCQSIFIADLKQVLICWGV